MLKQGTIPTALQDTSLHGSLSHSGPPLPTWPITNNGMQMNWAQAPVTGNHHQSGSRDFSKDIRVLPAIQNMNNNAIVEPVNAGELDSIEMGTKLNPGRRIEYLEKTIQFLKAQHQELVTSLHEEVDSLQRKNKELQFCMVMMQQNMQTGKEQDKRRDHLSTKRQITKSTQGFGQSGGVVQRGTNAAVDESSSSHQEDETIRSGPIHDGTPRPAETISQFQGSDKLEELKLLFPEEEIKDLRKALDCERKQNLYLTEPLRKTHQDRDAAAAAGAVSASEKLMEQEISQGLIDRVAIVLHFSGYRLCSSMVTQDSHGYLMACEKAINKKQLSVRIVEHNTLTTEHLKNFFPHQLSIVQHLRHPNLLRTYKILPQEDFTCLIVEKAPGGSLLSYITARGRLRESLARFIFFGILSAVQFLHSMNMAHRNIKCDNILVGGCDEPKLSDFGFARKMVDPVTNMRVLSETYCGSSSYAAPEVIRGIPYNAMSADVWSLGVVLYAMLAGMLPFDDANLARMVKDQLSRSYALPPDLSAECKALIGRMLEPDLGTRLTLDGVMLDNWM